MKTWSLGHLADHELLRDLTALAARERVNTAELLAHIAEVDERKLYVPAAYGCMRDWCVGELKMSEDAAAKRIHVARVARRFPLLLAALADGRLHLSGMAVLASNLTGENVDELVTAATHRSKKQIEDMLRQRFPKSDELTLVTETPGAVADSHAPGHVQSPDISHAPGHAEQAHVRIERLSASSFSMTLTLSRETNDKLEYAKDLLSHAVPSGDAGVVIDRALDALITKLEQKKFGVTSRARAGIGRKSVSPRHIPTAVRRAIHQRDAGRCTFVSASGRRCDATTRLEFDHETPVARGGQSTTANLRLRCRTHNQYAAEQAYGKEFMRGKREKASAPRSAAPPRKSHETPSETVARSVAAETISDEPLDAAPPCDDLDVTPWLRKLGYSAAQARAAAERCDELVDATLEQRVRYGLSLLLAPHRKENVRTDSASA